MGSQMCIRDRYEATAAEAQAKGYRTPVINLRDVFRSYPINILYSVNREIDAWRRSESEDQKAKHYGAAERYAKTLSDAIVNLVPRNGGGDNQFFIDTAQNMITGFILLVSLYAPPEARHIISAVSYTHLDADCRRLSCYQGE